MTKGERRKLNQALKSARATRTIAYDALLAAGHGPLRVGLEKAHREACALEAAIHQLLLKFHDAPAAQENP